MDSCNNDIPPHQRTDLMSFNYVSVFWGGKIGKNYFFLVFYGLCTSHHNRDGGNFGLVLDPFALPAEIILSLFSINQDSLSCSQVSIYYA